jgi:hypothetical protein
MKSTFAVLAALAVSAGGCASVTRGTTEDVTVQSEPSGAVVRTTKEYSCAATPCVMKVKRKDEFTVMLSKQGYKETHIDVVTRMSGAGGAGLAGNILIGGLIGVGVDAATGATLDHYPNPVFVVMQPDDGKEPRIVRPVPSTPPVGPVKPKKPDGPPVS